MKWQLGLCICYLFVCLTYQISTANAQKASPTGGGWLKFQTPDFGSFASTPTNETLDVKLQGEVTFEMWFYTRIPIEDGLGTNGTKLSENW